MILIIIFSLIACTVSCRLCTGDWFSNKISTHSKSVKLSRLHVSVLISPKLSNADRGQYLDLWSLGNTSYSNLTCTCGVINNDSKLLISEPGSNSGGACCVRLRANTLGTGMNLPLLPSSYGLISTSSLTKPIVS